MSENTPHRFQKLVGLIAQDASIKIKYKDESAFMKFLNIFMRYFSPTFMTRFTTTIGNTVYFPSRAYVSEQENMALRILAHEAVHLLDAKKWTGLIFSISYLFPQALALGVFTFPVFGWWAMLFLAFLLPIPSPSRFHWESRAYVINILTHSKPKYIIEHYLDYFSSWDYYRMYPFKKRVKRKIEGWIEKTEKNEDKILTKVMLWYENVV